jgi:hypothetical protein
MESIIILNFILLIALGTSLIACAYMLAVVCCLGPGREVYAEDNNAQAQAQTHYVLRAHLFDQQFQDALEKMEAELPRESVWILFDSSKAAPPPEFQERYAPRLILHTQEDCQSINPLHVSMWHTADSSLAIMWDHMLLHSKSEKDLDYVWLIESDVYCDGSYARCFDKALRSKADFVVAYLERYGDLDKNGVHNDNWCWWDSLVGIIADEVPRQERYKSFFPVSRYSKQMLKAVNENLGRSSGFCECYIPTLTALVPSLTLERCPDDMIGDLDTMSAGWKLSPASLPNARNDKFWHKYYYYL